MTWHVQYMSDASSEINASRTSLNIFAYALIVLTKNVFTHASHVSILCMHLKSKHVRALCEVIFFNCQQKIIICFSWLLQDNSVRVLKAS